MTYLMIGLPVVTEGFKQYLVGLLDGYGSFQTYAKRNGGTITLRCKDTVQNKLMLLEIQNKLGIGKVYSHESQNNTLRLMIFSKKDLELCKILFELYPLITTNMNYRYNVMLASLEKRNFSPLAFCVKFYILYKNSI